MKEILTDYYSAAQSALYEYLKKNIDSFNDKTLFKAIQINCINADDESTPSDVYARQCENLKDKLKTSIKSDDNTLWLATLLVEMNNENYDEIAYILYDKLDYDTIDPDLLKKLELLRRLSRLLYLNEDDKLIPALINLLEMDGLPLDFNWSGLLFEFYYMDDDTIDSDEHFLMAETVLQFQPDNFDALCFRAFLKTEASQYLDALDCYLKCIEFSPSNHLAWMSMRIADVYLSLKEYEKVIDYSNQAIKCFEKFNKVGENSHEKLFFSTVYTLRSQGFMGIQRYDLAMSDIERGLTFDDEHIHLTNLQEIVEKHLNK